MLKNKQEILDEAARSVRRTFIGSVAGTLGMLAVIGAAGAYGMPENLTARALTLAMAKLNIKLPNSGEQPTKIDRAVKVVAANDAMPMPASDATPAAAPAAQAAASPANPVRTVPAEPVQTVPAATPEPQAVAADSVKPAAPAPAVEAASAARSVAPRAAALPAPSEPAPPLAALPLPSDPEPEDTPVVAATEPRADETVMPAAADAMRPAAADAMARATPESDPALSPIPTSLVFETPKLSDIKPLAALPPTEPVAATPEAAKPADKSAEQTIDVPLPVEFPKLATLPMPPAKPPLTPAQRLDLAGKSYDKAQHCLAQAIYFEARAEPARGQMAVAQVVLNRVFSPYYPKDICSVVYQNADHHLACQFTFACDGKPERVTERGPWLRANRIAKQALDAKIWLPDVAKATHYHAAYVRPNWVREMKTLARYGLHTFYRPRNWGDGSNEPAWGAGAKKTAAKS